MPEDKEKDGGRSLRKKGHRIKTVLPGGIAEEMGVLPGMTLVSINGKPVRDVLDYRFLAEEPHLEVGILNLKGEPCLLEFDRGEDEEFGVEFENPFMDDYKSCANHCIFCFIDQLPKGMRKSLYFKDDDSRLSFLQGNYITLTNLTDADLEQILAYRMEPINISIHTMNPALRCRMLRNRFAGEALNKLDRLFYAGIRMNGQIVLCRGWNDGEELDRTLAALARYRPLMQSVSVVPVGLTKYRKGLTKLLPFSREEARDVLRRIGRYPHFAYAADEWFLKAGEAIPKAEDYDGYPQFENGVGMLRSFLDEVEEGLRRRREAGEIGFGARPLLSAACGLLAEPYLKEIAAAIPEGNLSVYGIRNEFFGDGVTVSGLLTGGDLFRQLKDKNLGKALLLTVNALRAGEEVFLDDWTVSELEEKLSVPIVVVGQSGEDFLDALFLQKSATDSKRQVYEH